MGDIIWFIIIGAILIVLGLIIIWLGYNVWIKQKINLIIIYHMDKVSDDNKPAFCRLSGLGLLVMGCGFIASGIWTMVSGALLSFIPMIVGIVVGIVLFVSAGVKYNK